MNTIKLIVASITLIASGLQAKQDVIKSSKQCAVTAAHSRSIEPHTRTQNKTAALNVADLNPTVVIDGQRMTMQEYAASNLEMAKTSVTPAHDYSAPKSALPGNANATINRMTQTELCELVLKAGDLYSNYNMLDSCEKDVRKHYETLKRGGEVNRALLANAAKSLLKDDKSATRACCLAEELNEIIALLEEKQACESTTLIRQQDINPDTGYVITTSGRYCLVEDITWTNTINPNIGAININASNVELNLNGHSIDLMEAGIIGVIVVPEGFPSVDTGILNNIIVHNGSIRNNFCNFTFANTGTNTCSPVILCDPNAYIGVGLILIDCQDVLIENIAIDSVSVGILAYSNFHTPAQIIIDSCSVNTAVNGIWTNPSNAFPGIDSLVIENFFGTCMAQHSIYANVITNLVIDNAISFDTFACSIFPTNISNCVIKNCIGYTSRGFNVFQPTFINGLYITNCQAYNALSSANIFADFCLEVLIENCVTASAAADNIVLEFSNVVQVNNCIASNAHDNGLFVGSVQGCSITNCTFSDNTSGISVSGVPGIFNSNGVTISGCTINNSSQNGIAIGVTQSATIKNCLVTNSVVNNLFMNAVSQIVIQDTACYNSNGSNVNVSGCDGIVIDHCITNAAGTAGIFVENSNNVTVANSHTSAAEFGVQVSASNGVVVTDCRSNANATGIEINSSSNCLVQNNTSYSNSNAGIAESAPTGINNYFGNNAYNNTVANYAGLPVVAATLVVPPSLCASTYDNIDWSLNGACYVCTHTIIC